MPRLQPLRFRPFLLRLRRVALLANRLRFDLSAASMWRIYCAYFESKNPLYHEWVAETSRMVSSPFKRRRGDESLVAPWKKVIGDWSFRLPRRFFIVNPNQKI
jgi:hypothetical protein